MNKAMGEVMAERYRQVYELGHTFEHDDKHLTCELAQAAASYALALPNHRCAVQVYPWTGEPPNASSFIGAAGPGSHRQNCVKAAALLIAEIERIDRRYGPHANMGTVPNEQDKN